MKDLFEDEKRNLSDSEIVYQITNNLVTSAKVERILRNCEYISIEEICEELTPARKNLALAVIEMYKRLQERGKAVRQIRNSQHIYDLMYKDMIDLHVEECWCIFLNQAANVIRKERISKGGLASTQVDIRVILREALKVEATSLILVHNHPSGNTRPSGDDDRLTTSLHNACKTLNIRMLDHVVFADNTYYSYADEGRI